MPEHIDFDVLGEPVSDNDKRMGHRMAKARVIAEWRELAGWSLREHLGRAGVPQWERAQIQFVPMYERGPYTDPGNTSACEKAIIDGCVDVGLLPDDNRWHNAGRLSLPCATGTSVSGFHVRLLRFDTREGHLPRTECGCRRANQNSQVANLQRKREARGR